MLFHTSFFRLKNEGKAEHCKGATPLEQGLGLESSFRAMPSSLPAHFYEIAKKHRKESRKRNHQVRKSCLLTSKNPIVYVVNTEGM